MATINIKVAVAYKFLDLFRVQLKHTSDDIKGLHWSSCAVESELSDEQLIAFKQYLKVKKTELRAYNDPTKAIKFGRILWFFYHKLLEFGAFTLETRQEIRAYLDLCEYILL